MFSFLLSSEHERIKFVNCNVNNISLKFLQHLKKEGKRSLTLVISLGTNLFKASFDSIDLIQISSYIQSEPTRDVTS